MKKITILKLVLCTFLSVNAGTKKLRNACRKGNLEEVTSILSQKPHLLDKPDKEYDWTPLGWAACSVANNPNSQQHATVFLHLLNQGADPYTELEDDYGPQTPFSYIAEAQNIALLQAILNKKQPSPKAFDTALYNAFFRKSDINAFYLLNNGATDYSGDSLVTVYHRLSYAYKGILKAQPSDKKDEKILYHLSMRGSKVSLDELGDSSLRILPNEELFEELTEAQQTMIYISEIHDDIDRYCNGTLTQQEETALLKDINELPFVKTSNTDMIFQYILNYVITKIDHKGATPKSRVLLLTCLKRLAKEYVLAYRFAEMNTDNSPLYGDPLDSLLNHDAKLRLNSVAPGLTNKAIRMKSGEIKTVFELFKEEIEILRQGILLKRQQATNQNAGQKRTSDSDRSNEKRTH